MADPNADAEPVADAKPAPSVEERLTALEGRWDALVQELHRHISLRLDTPAEAPPAAQG